MGGGGGEDGCREGEREARLRRRGGGGEVEAEEDAGAGCGGGCDAEEKEETPESPETGAGIVVRGGSWLKDVLGWGFLMS